MNHDPDIVLPNFSQGRRTELRRQQETEARRCQAQGKRIFARALVETRIREAQAKVVALEDASAIGSLLTSIGMTGWKKIFATFGVSAPTEMLERIADLARRQLARLIAEDGPQTISIADELANVIEQGETAEEAPLPNGVGNAPAKANGSALLPGPTGGGRWG